MSTALFACCTRQRFQYHYVIYSKICKLAMVQSGMLTLIHLDVISGYICPHKHHWVMYIARNITSVCYILLVGGDYNVVDM